MMLTSRHKEAKQGEPALCVWGEPSSCHPEKKMTTSNTPHNTHHIHLHSLALGPAASRMGVNFNAMAIDPPIFNFRVMNSC